MWIRIALTTVLLLACVPDSPVAPFQTSTTFTIKYRYIHPEGPFCWENGSWGTICPIVNAKVASSCGTAQTNASGNATFVCSGTTISGNITQTNGRYLMYPSTSLLVPVTDNFSGSGGGTILVQTWNDTTAYFYNFVQELDSVAMLLFSRTVSGTVKVSPRAAAAVVSWCNVGPGVPGCYDPSSTTIVLRDDEFRTPPGAGILVLSHEMGHAFHHLAIGDMCSTSEVNACWHWREGFADFLGVYIGSRLYNQGNYLEANAGAEGLFDRYNIGATLLDMADSAGSNDHTPGVDDDSVTWPASYIRDLVTTCSGKVFVIWFHEIRWPDLFLVCAERNLNARLAAPSWDQGNWVQFNAFTEGATEPPTWSLTKVRQLWLYNLYGQGSLP